MKHLIRNYKNLPLARKFALAILSLGLFPVLVLFPLFYYLSASSTRQVISDNYHQAASAIATSTDNAFRIYDTASRMMYQYSGQFSSVNVYADYQLYDTVRQILADPDGREGRMQLFLRAVQNIDSHILAVHMLTDSEEDDVGQRQYHYSAQSTWFRDEAAFEKAVDYAHLDRDSRNLMISLPHDTSYYGLNRTVITLSRNYYDLRGTVLGKYIGTIYLDVDISVLQQLFSQMNLTSAAQAYLVDDRNVCYYSTNADLNGKNIDGVLSAPGLLLFSTDPGSFGLHILLTVPESAAYASIQSLARGFLIILVIVLGLLILFTWYLSRSLTQPIQEITSEMKRVENGDFNIHLPVRSQDEIGMLAQRFNEMSAELEQYINQSYVAKLRQNEAELTALRSQIYPHFLYNTLEIIRMSALEDGDEKVSSMIEALSSQIHYLIGTMDDLVPLSRELDIIRKYVYLLNCRIEGKVSLLVDVPEGLDPLIPRLALQPVVENAYVHGIRPRTGSGSIMISALRVPSAAGQGAPGEDLEIDIMDNGAGMDEAQLEQLQKLLQGDQPGIRNKDNWQSIGLKNVHDRLRFLYGETYGIEITSAPGVGTSVQLRLPLQLHAAESGGEKNAADDHC